MATKKANKVTFNYGGVQISMTKSKTKAAVQYAPGQKKAASKRSQRGAAALPEELDGFEVFSAKRNLDQKLDELRSKPEVSVGTHVWHVGEEEDYPFIPTGNLYIEFKPGTDDQKQRDLMDEFDLNVFEVVGPDAYRVSVTPTSPNPIKCVTLLQKKKIIQIAEPEFVTKPVTNNFSPPTGPFISTQWHLENTGTAIPIVDIAESAVYGSSHFKKGADAKVKEAWAFLGNMGSKDLKIAVIDTGFAIDHPQLRGDGTKIRNTFNAAERHNDVSPVFQASDGNWGVFSHGTSCAAVAAGALDQGIVGAAPNSKIIPIKLDILSDSAIKNAFEHALLNGADIVSCSLGFPMPVPLSTFISNYITKVAREGRGGKGLPLFFAAGNANPASDNAPREISDFAAHPESICVTASNSLDEPSDYSFFGPNAFLCAPTNGNDGVGITTATVDVDKSTGQIVLGYTSGFGGTSSATPLAAGICALMLTANPNLRLSDIKNVLRQSTDKIGSGYNANGHSPQLGYGRINALKAVKMATGNGAMAATTTTTGTTATAPQRGKVTSKFLNVRSGPGTANPKVAELKQGEIVTLFEKVSGWWRIGQGQFVSGDFIQVLAANNAPANARKGKVTSPFLNVRSGPGTNNPKTGELKQGALVTIFETSNNGWHRIGVGKWVSGSNVQEI